MKKLYEKNQVTFAIIWIVIYVAGLSLADSISASIGIQKIITVPLCVVLTLVLVLWAKKSNLLEKFGLKPSKTDYKSYFYFAPMLIICSTNLWAGVTLNFTVIESVLYVLSMICVGFLEEFIFRGLFFTAMRKDGLKSAVIVSSLTFGIGHIVNLLNGAAVAETLLQICYATAIGFLFTIIFHKTNNLYPCIITHAAVNSLSAFAVDREGIYDIAAAVVLIVVSVGYAVWIIKKCK